MITKNEINSFLNDSLKKYSKSWLILSTIKGKDKKKLKPYDFIDFQVDLGKTLYALTNKYRKIIQEKKSLIQNKSKYHNGWFVRRMNQLSDFQKLLNQHILMGKTLGDAFCWLFYSTERKLLKKHLEHPSQFHSPPGIGGIGEVEFIRNVQAIKNHLTLYHGITNFLRIADFSYINLETHKLSALGELKTKEDKPGNLSIVLNLIGVKNSYDVFETVKIKKENKNNKIQVDNWINDKLIKQTERMRDFWDEPSLKTDSKIDMRLGNIVDYSILQELIENTKSNKLYHMKYDGGVILSCYRKRKGSPTDSLLFNKDKSFDKDDNLVDFVKDIAIKDSRYNSLAVSSFLYHNERKLNWYQWLTPLFWMPITIDSLKQIYFGEVVIITTFNPASFLNKLEKNGFEIKIIKQPLQIKISKKIGKRLFEIPDISFYLGLIQYHLFKEREVIKIIEKLEKIKIPNHKSNIKGVTIFPDFDFIF